MQIYGKFIYKKPKIRIFTKKYNELESKIKELEKFKNDGFLLGFISYEAGIFLSNLENKFDLRYDFNDETKVLLDFTLYEKREKITKNLLKTDDFCFYPKFIDSINKNEYKTKFKATKKLIEENKIEQLNLTYNLKFKTNLEPFEMFKEILYSQNTKYRAFIQNDQIVILSFSPELFFKLKNNKIKLKPMKGTFKRGLNKFEDAKNKMFLKHDPKNRLENLLALNLAKSELQKLSKKVKIYKKYHIQKHKSLFQMTSSLKANLKNPNLLNLFQTLLPAASITGYPKPKCIENISNIEENNRNIYCGIIGVIGKKETIFSVAIRMIYKYKNDDFYNFGVGGGLGKDSVLDDEFNETKLKTSFLTNLRNFELFETMKFNNKSVFLLSLHLRRILKSAKILNFETSNLTKLLENFKFKKYENINISNLQNLINSPKFYESFENFNSKIINPNFDNGILKLYLSKNGDFRFEFKPFNVVSSNKITFAKKRINSKDELIFHKTTDRKRFDKFDEKYLFDKIYLNDFNQICEGSRSNIIIEKNGAFLTPKLECGLLSGVLRELLITNQTIKESILTKDDIINADKIYCINSLRGAVKVELVD